MSFCLLVKGFLFVLSSSTWLLFSSTSLPTWLLDWNGYAAGLAEHGYHVELKRVSDGEVKGYTVAKGNSVYKSSELDKGRKLMPSKIMATWRLYHPEATKRTVVPAFTPTKPRPQSMTSAKPLVLQSNSVTSVDSPKMHHFDFSTDEFHKYPVDISDKALNVINENISLDSDNVFATIDGIQKTALLLFANYLDAATTVAAQNGGGGGGQTSGWGRDKDEDELSWAHRCAMMANRLCAPRRKMGQGR